MKKGSQKPASDSVKKESKDYRNLRALVDTRADQVFDPTRPVFNAADILGISITPTAPAIDHETSQKLPEQPATTADIVEVAQAPSLPTIAFDTPEALPKQLAGEVVVQEPVKFHTEKLDLGTEAEKLPQLPKVDPTSLQNHSQFYSDLPIASIQPGRYQPRQNFDSEALEELIMSIKANGLLNPILVREVSLQRYEIIAGERRWRACRELQLTTIAAIIQHRSDEGAAIQSLLENIVRDDLSSYEQALGMQRLITEFGIRKMDVADKLGFSPPRVSQMLSILELPEPILHLMFKGKKGLTESHARILLPVKDNPPRLERLVREAIEKSWGCEKLKSEVERQPRTNAGAQAVRFDYRGFEGTNGFRLQVRYHPNRDHDKSIIKQALKDALHYLETGRPPLPTSSPESPTSS